MYYVTLDESDENKLTYKCRRCGHVDELLESVCVLKTQLKRGAHQYQHMVNEYTKLDPTLPRIRNLKCPNPECKFNKEDKTAEVIYVRYDDNNLKYLYICVECDTTWKTN